MIVRTPMTDLSFGTFIGWPGLAVMGKNCVKQCIVLVVVVENGGSPTIQFPKAERFGGTVV